MYDVKRTTGAGSLYDAIWTPVGTPASGDQLIINHSVTWTPNVSDMWLGSGQGHSIAFGSAGKLTLMPTGTFSLHLAGATGSGNISQFEFVVDSTSGTVNINFDATQNSVGFPIAVGDTYDVNNRGGWNLVGNATYPINVTSFPSNGTKNSYFTASQAGGGNVNANYVNFTRIGAATRRAFVPLMTSTRQPSIVVTNSTLTSCGEYQLSGDSNYTGIVRFTNTKWITPVTDNSTYYAMTINFGTDGYIPRLFSGCHFPSVTKFLNPYNAYFENCLFESGLICSNVTARWSGINNSVLHNVEIYADSPIGLNGNLTNSLLYWDAPTRANPHFISYASAIVNPYSVLFSGNVFYSNTYSSDGNCIVGGGLVTLDILKNIILPNASGGTTGSLLAANGEIVGSGKINVRSNTANVAGQWGIEVGHLIGPNITNVTDSAGSIVITVASAQTWATNDTITVIGVGGVTNANGTWVITRSNSTTYTLNGSTFAGSYTSGGNAWKRETPNRYNLIADNIFWGSGNGSCGTDVDTTKQIDIIPLTAIDKNCRFAVAETAPSISFTNQGNGWHMTASATPGATDLNADPLFVNSGVSIGAWAVTQGSVSSNWYDKEKDAMTYIRANLNLIPNLINYIRDGYRIRNPALFTASTTGGPIGAGSVYSNPAKPINIKTGSNLSSNIFTGGIL